MNDMMMMTGSETSDESSNASCLSTSEANHFNNGLEQQMPNANEEAMMNSTATTQQQDHTNNSTMNTQQQQQSPRAIPFWRDQEQIVISGVSGRFPRSANVQEFGDLLMAGEDLITEDDLRWPPGKITNSVINYFKGNFLPDFSDEIYLLLFQAYTDCQNGMEN